LLCFLRYLLFQKHAEAPILFDIVRLPKCAKVRWYSLIFEYCSILFDHAHEWCLDEDDKSTVGALMRVSREFCEGDSGGIANDR
jgi:hypothetical protein